MGFWMAAAPIIGGLLGAAGGIAQARGQRQAAEAASRPRPFWREDSPYAPTIPFLDQALQDALQVYEHQRNFRPPPMRSAGGGANRQALNELAEEARRRAMSSTFIPQAQQAALGMMQGRPNPFLAQAFSAVQNFRPPQLGMPSNPYLAQLLSQLLPQLGGGGIPLGLPPPAQPGPQFGPAQPGPQLGPAPSGPQLRL